MSFMYCEMISETHNEAIVRHPALASNSENFQAASMQAGYHLLLWNVSSYVKWGRWWLYDSIMRFS